ncbi:MAG TPA: permease-like cell division protein FtsX [Desulfomonilia bacterium]|nr:permease-like cell division protein FtsX [Desulfomonilia bacterium]
MIRIYYIIKLIMRGLRHRPWGSMLTLIACWFALCQLSFVFYVVDVADRVSSMPSTSSSMIAYLKDSTPQDKIAELEKSLRSIIPISTVQFIPKQEGLEKMKQWLGSDSSLVEGVDPQILPDAFEISLKREYADKVGVIAKTVGSLPGVDDVRYRKGLIGYIAGSFSQIVLGASILGAIVVICLALLIFLSIRVGIVSRKQEIEVMNMLGANALFIYAPYLIEAGAYGFLGSCAALITTSVAYRYMHVHFTSLQAFLRPLDSYEAAGVLFFACFCSILGALLAIKRSIDA